MTPEEQDFLKAAMCVAFSWSGRVEYDQPFEHLLDELVDAFDIADEALGGQGKAKNPFGV